MLELEHGFRIVDAHLSIEPDAVRRSRNVGDPEQVERELHQAGIIRGLALPPGRDGGYLTANNAVARMAVDRPFLAAARIAGTRGSGRTIPSRLQALGRSESTAPAETTPAAIEQYAYEDRFVAFALDPAADGLPEESVLEAVERTGLPTVTYGGRGFEPSRIEKTLLRYDIPLVIAHYGGYPLERDLMHETIDLLGEYDQCYVDTSFVRFRDILERALMEHPDRVLFGSGAPRAHPNVAVMELLTLDVPEDAMRRAFSKNVARVIPELGER